MPTQDDKYRSYTSGNFEFRLDGEPTGIYLKSVDGGFMTTKPAEASHGGGLLATKAAATRVIAPINLEFGLSSSRGLMDWISQAWKENPVPHDGEITHANARYQETFSHEFRNAYITQTAFPALDGASKDAGYLKVTIQPGAVTTTRLDSTNVLKTNSNETQKMWLPSKFRFTLDDVPGMEYTNKLEGFTIQHNVETSNVGKIRDPNFTPHHVKFPDLVGTIALSRAEGLHDWYERYIVNGQDDASALTNGSIEMLTPDGKTTILTIDLYGCGLKEMAIAASSANSDEIKRVKFTIFVTKMDLDLEQYSYYDND